MNNIENNGNSFKEENNDILSGLNVNINSINNEDDIKPGESNSKFLTEISKKIEEENLKKELENKKYIDNFALIIKNYVISVNENKSIISYISDESIKKNKRKNIVII